MSKHESGGCSKPHLHRVGLAVRVRGRSTGEKESASHHCLATWGIPICCLGDVIYSSTDVGVGRHCWGSMKCPWSTAGADDSSATASFTRRHPSLVQPMLQTTEAAAVSQISTTPTVDIPKPNTWMPACAPPDDGGSRKMGNGGYIGYASEESVEGEGMIRCVDSYPGLLLLTLCWFYLGRAGQPVRVIPGAFKATSTSACRSHAMTGFIYIYLSTLVTHYISYEQSYLTPAQHLHPPLSEVSTISLLRSKSNHEASKGRVG